MSELINRALALSKKAHDKQVDKAGVDYIQHPIYVASLVETEYEKTVALLHDVVEDSNISLLDLKEMNFPSEVVEAVALLTKDKTISYQAYLEKIKGNEIARKVKLADLTHNSDISRLIDITPADEKRIQKYRQAIKYLKSTDIASKQNN